MHATAHDRALELAAHSSDRLQAKSSEGTSPPLLAWHQKKGQHRHMAIANRRCAVIRSTGETVRPHVAMAGELPQDQQASRQGSRSCERDTGLQMEDPMALHHDDDANVGMGTKEARRPAHPLMHGAGPKGNTQGARWEKRTAV